MRSAYVPRRTPNPTRCVKHGTPYSYVGHCIKCLHESIRQYQEAMIQRGITPLRSCSTDKDTP